MRGELFSNGILEKTRCAVINCLNNTDTTHMCEEHLSSKLNLKVATSTIKGAGRGLFTLKKRRKGEKVAYYYGDLIKTDLPFGGDYVLKVDYDLYIDARSTCSGPGRFANSIKDTEQSFKSGKSNNVEFVWNMKSQEAYLVAVMYIPAGSEIFAQYEKDEGVYWSEYKCTQTDDEEPDQT